jgi:Domain of unknown function (DUF5658)
MPRRDGLAWSLLLATAQLADVASTWLGLRAGLREENPLVRAALGQGDFLLFTLVKLALVAALLLLVAATARHLRAHRLSWLAVRGLAVGLTLVAAVNTAGVLMTVGTV